MVGSVTVIPCFAATDALDVVLVAAAFLPLVAEVVVDALVAGVVGFVALVAGLVDVVVAFAVEDSVTAVFFLGSAALAFDFDDAVDVDGVVFSAFVAPEIICKT